MSMSTSIFTAVATSSLQLQLLLTYNLFALLDRILHCVFVKCNSCEQKNSTT